MGQKEVSVILENARIGQLLIPIEDFEQGVAY